MKKRFCAGLLVLSMLLPMLSVWTPFASAAQRPPVSAASGTEDNSNPAPYAKYATNEGAALKGLTFEQSDAWNLKIRSTDVRKGCQTYVVVLRYDLFDSNYNRDGAIGGIDAAGYNTLKPGTDNPNYYRTENQTATAGMALDIFNKDLYNFTKDPAYSVSEDSDKYHMKYAAIIFDGATDLDKKLTDYTIVTFYMDSEGWLQRESYMLRYMKNTYPVGNGTGATGLPGYTIHDWEADAPVNSSTTPKRTGYTFLGWDPDAKLMPSDPNTAAANPATPKFPAGNNGPVAWTDIAEKFKEAAPNGYGTDAYEKNRDKFYNLYAVWKPDQVVFNTTGTTTKTLTVNGTPQEIPVKTLPSPQVGKAYTATLPLLVPTTNTATDKDYTYITGVTVPLDGGGSTTTINLKTAASASDPKLKYDLGITSGRTSCIISGTPTGHSKGSEIYALLQVKDKTNETTDLLLLRFEEIKKGAQPTPTLDDNTGLQSKIETVGEGEAATKDGQIYGFYSPGPTIQTADNATGYLTTTNDPKTGTYGTGSMAGYYKEKRMVYQFRPAKLTVAKEDGTTEQVTLVDQNTGEPTAEGTAYFATLPNDGWREVPMPEDYYPPGRLTQAVVDKLKQSMEKNASIVMTTDYAPGITSHAPVTEITNLPEGFTGWPDGYGAITFENKLPVLHGLTENDIYEVRFRSNSSYETSDSRWITVGGAVGGGGGETVSGGLAVNLAGGSVLDDKKAAFEAFVEQCHALQPGDTIPIPAADTFEPVRETYSFYGWTLGDVDETGQLITYKTGDSCSVTLGENPMALTAVWNSTTQGILSVTAFDWDGTLLGSFSFKADSDPKVQGDNAEAALKEFMGEAYPKEPEPTPPPSPTPGGDDGNDDNTGDNSVGNEGNENQNSVSVSTKQSERSQLRNLFLPAYDPSADPFAVTARYAANNSLMLLLNDEPQAVTLAETNDVNQGSLNYNIHTLSDAGETTSSGDGNTGTGGDGTSGTGGETAVSGEGEGSTEETNAVAKVLKSHSGYDFLAWVKNEDDVPTSYGARPYSYAVGELTTLEIDSGNKVDFSTLTASTTVKAAYTSNDSITLYSDKENAGSADHMAAREYNTTIVGYNRFGATPNYSITIQVERGNVPRATNGFLLVRSVIGGVSTYSRYKLTGADIETIEVALYADTTEKAHNVNGVSLVEWTVIDTYGYSNWVNAGNRTNLSQCQATADFTIQNVGTAKNQQVWSAGTYPYYGMITSVYEQLMARDTAGTEMTVTYKQMRNLGIPPSSTNDVTLCTRIYTNWCTLGKPQLTYEILYEIVSQKTISQ